MRESTHTGSDGVEADTNRKARKEKEREQPAADEGSHSLMLCRLVVAFHLGAKRGLVVGRLKSDADSNRWRFSLSHRHGVKSRTHCVSNGYDERRAKDLSFDPIFLYVSVYFIVN